MHAFVAAGALDPTRVGYEAARLAGAADLAPGLVLDAEFEETFYRTGNLPEQLRTLFAPINPRRVDEDLLEVLCARAQALLRGTALLDDAVQQFYRGLVGAGVLGGPIHLRRDGERLSETALATPPGTPVLFALKKLWARDWSFETVLARLDDQGGVALEARPVLLFAGGPGRADPALAARLGWPRALVNERGIVGA